MARIKDRRSLLDYSGTLWNSWTPNIKASMIDIKNKHIIVIGAARSGLAAAMLLQEKGASVFVTDHNNIKASVKTRLDEAHIPFEENGHSPKALQGDFAVLSPGVPTDTPVVQQYFTHDQKVYSEIEAASWFNQSRLTAVTGSNGKTTVTNWLDHTWKLAERSHEAAGNIGYAFSDVVRTSPEVKEVLLEVSSFQLDHIDTFHPKVSILLNITPDHLDRYDNDFYSYAAAKYRITKNQSGDDWLIYNNDDSTIKTHVEELKKKEHAPHLLGFSRRHELPQIDGAFVRNKNIILKFNQNEEVLMPISEVKLPGKHNLNNGLATALAARVSEIKNDVIRESLSSFEGVEHRLEPVRTVNGVDYINDSKATNINAVWYALDSFNMPLTLILGG